MIRKSISKAFGRSVISSGANRSSATLSKTSLSSAMQEMFEDLREAFQKIIEKRDLSKNSDPTLGITAVQQELEGQKFIVQCASGTFHFRSSMNGIIWLFKEEHQQLLLINMLSLYPDELGLPQLIEKSVQSMRAPFRFTSIPRVVEDVLGSVK